MRTCNAESKKKDQQKVPTLKKTSERCPSIGVITVRVLYEVGATAFSSCVLEKQPFSL